MSTGSKLRMAVTRFTDRTTFVDGLPPVLRRPDFWARSLSELMDIITFVAIYLTTEVQVWPFVVAGGLSAVRLLTRIRFTTIWIVAGFLIQIFVGIQLVLRLQLHPIVAAAHVAPIGMAWIGLTRGGEELWGWRMGLGFIGLILASALTPEFSVMLMILAFVIAGSIGLACRFLSGEFIRRGVTGTLPPGFIRSSFYQSGILLLSALLIFPLIPRVQGRAGGFGNDTPKSGYSEEVNLNDWTRVSNQGSSTPALRIYGPNGMDPNPFIPFGLLRSRVLSILDGSRWNPGPIKIDPSRKLGQKKPSANLMIVREMTGPANLPVPYGTREVSVELYGYKWDAEQTMISEWREGRSRNQRFNYYANVEMGNFFPPQDEPTSTELGVPANFRSPRMKALADRLFQGKKTAESKIAAVIGHFQKEHFQAVYAEDELSPRDNVEEKKLPPIERFLFAEKSGHCELFASAMAILLRMGGVPTRLIAGFRVVRNAYGDVLTVRQSDAHAWIEAYVPGHGWMPSDPTPKVLHFSTISDWVRDTYDWASAKWTQYILNYGEGENSFRAQWDRVKKIGSQMASGKNPFKSGDAEANLYLFSVIFLIGAVLLSFGAVAVFRNLRRPKATFRLDKIKLDLIRERKRMDRLSARIEMAKIDKRELELSVKNWFALYEKARFGEGTALDRELLAEIRRNRAEIESGLRRAS